MPNCISKLSAVIRFGPAMTQAFATIASSGLPSARSPSAHARVLAGNAGSSFTISKLPGREGAGRISLAALLAFYISRAVPITWAPWATSVRESPNPFPRTHARDENTLARRSVPSTCTGTFDARCNDRGDLSTRGQAFGDVRVRLARNRASRRRAPNSAQICSRLSRRKISLRLPSPRRRFTVSPACASPTRYSDLFNRAREAGNIHSLTMSSARSSALPTAITAQADKPALCV